MSLKYDRDPEEGLEVPIRVQVEQALQVFRGCVDLEAMDPSANGFVRINAESLIEKYEQSSPDRQPRKKKWLILVLSGVALFVIVAAVLGLRLNNNNSRTPAETPQAFATPPATSSKPSNDVYVVSGIRVIGWWTCPSSFTIRLYQQQNGYLRLVRYHSGDGNWSTLTIFSDTNAKLGSPIAASSFNIPFYGFSPITSSNNFTQVEIFHLNS
ncbi:hypothetical protein MKX08_004254 [Trichoderma sp. CBMAI-0020]|nr:hypothetical protein MKX08_004254 [Trichoderma sp. CBMAI-0020]